MKYGSFCTGYGGLDLAVETYFEDAEMLWYSEVDKNCNKILRFGRAEGSDFDLPKRAQDNQNPWGLYPTRRF